MTTDEQLALIYEMESFAVGGGHADESVTRRVISICLTLRQLGLPGFELTAVERQFRDDYRYGDFEKMLTLRHASDVLPFHGRLRRVWLDGPFKTAPASEMREEAKAALEAAAIAGGGDLRGGFLRDHVCRDGCSCLAAYSSLSSAELRRLLGTEA